MNVSARIVFVVHEMFDLLASEMKYFGKYNLGRQKNWMLLNVFVCRFKYSVGMETVTYLSYLNVIFFF